MGITSLVWDSTAKQFVYVVGVPDSLSPDSEGVSCQRERIAASRNGTRNLNAIVDAERVMRLTDATVLAVKRPETADPHE